VKETVLGLNYCEKCEEDIERVHLGYPPHNEPCKRWQCNLLDILNDIVTILICIPLLFVAIPIAIIFYFVDEWGGNNYAFQEQKNAERIPTSVGRKKSRKSGLGRVPLAPRKSKTQKRIRPEELEYP